MRFLVLALMIVLLPLRGWAADVMAVEMASHSVAMNSGAAGAHNSMAAAFSDTQNTTAPNCHGTLVGDAPSSETASNNNVSNNEMSDGHSGTCQACQACHTVALSPPPAAASGSLLSPRLRPMHAFVFTSAAAALRQKPPIS